MLVIWLFKVLIFQMLFAVCLTLCLVLPPIMLWWVLSIAPAYLYEYDDQDFMGDSHDDATPHWYLYYLHWFEHNQSWVPELAKFFDSDEEGEEEADFEDEVFLPDSYVQWGLGLTEKIKGRNELANLKMLHKEDEEKYFLILKKK